MPRFPQASSAAESIRGSVYSPLAARVTARAASHREIYPFHVGDTWKEPAEGCRMEDLTVAEYPGMHRYAPVQGIPELLDLLVERQRGKTGLAVERENIVLAGGATSGLANVVGAIASPGDEVLLAAPYWPLIEGIVRAFHAVPVAVPLFGIPDPPDSPESLVAAFEARRTPRTVALYVNTPNNPSGQLLPAPWLEALAEWARRHELWVMADDVYEDYVYDGAHAYFRALAPERTFAAHSFSKAYGMAGNRCGYVVGPKEIMNQALKIGTHTVYSTPTASQLAAVRVLKGPGEAWAALAREEYQDTARRASSRLGVPMPKGSTFLFLNVSPKIDSDPQGRGLQGFLADCADEGLLAAPGPSFGPYPHHIRVCYTAVPPDHALRGMEILAKLLGR